MTWFGGSLTWGSSSSGGQSGIGRHSPISPPGRWAEECWPDLRYLKRIDEGEVRNTTMLLPGTILQHILAVPLIHSFRT